MFKKFFSLVTTFTLLLSLVCINSVSAKEVKAENEITQDTVITENNILDVLEYLNLDSKDFIKFDTPKVGNDDTIKTVGDLKVLIDNVNKQPKEINITEDSKSKVNFGLFRSGTRSSGTKTLYRSSNIGDYTLTYDVSAAYSRGKWVNTYGGHVNVDSNSILLSHKIGKVDTLKTTNTSTNVNLKARFQLETYFIAKFGLLKVSSTWINSNVNWDSSYIPK